MQLRGILDEFRAARSRTVATVAALMVAALAVSAASARRAAAQEHPARRLSSIVGVAVEEYGKGIDAAGRTIAEQEWQEAVDFLADARGVADRLSGDRAAAVRAVLDSLAAAVTARRPTGEIQALHARFVAALGTEGALELPRRPIDVGAGARLYAANCASCHGPSGLGDGPAAKGMNPPPPAIGSAAATAAQSPALLFRVMSVGVPGTQMPAWGTRFTAEQRWDLVAYLESLHTTPAALLEGEGLFLQRCAACHGTTGAVDGVNAHDLTRLPPEIGTLAWQAERSDSQLVAVIRAGIPGSAMPPARDLSDADAAKIVAYVRSLATRGDQLASDHATKDTSAAAVSRTVLSLLDQSFAAAQAGRTGDAADRAFDSYLAFEPLETPARAKSPGLVASMERHFADFKGAVKAGDLRGAQRARDAIDAGMPAVLDLTRTASSPWAAFFQSFLIILREGFEAILVIGAVAAFLTKTGHHDRLRSIWLGAALALVASAAMAVVLRTVLSALPASGELIEGATMLVAVVVLFSVSYWLISKVEAAKWQQFIREKVTSALEHGGGKALALVAFLAVFREGAEVALFFQALFGEGPHVALPLSLGILVGFAALAVVFTLFYRFGVRIPLRPFFAVTSVMLYFMAFVFMGKGIRELQEGNAIGITAIPGFPHVDALGIFPTVETLLAQLLLVALFVLAVVKTFWPKRSVTLPTMPAPAPTPDLAERVAELQRRVEVLEAAVRDTELQPRDEMNV